MKRIIQNPLARARFEQPWTQVRLDSDLGQAKLLEDRILLEAQNAGYSQNELFALQLALEEALTNAIKHGNKFDATKSVQVEYRVNSQRLDVSIEDQGPGFNPAEVPDPTADENLEMNHGRGLMLMRAYMSSVVFNATGNRITMTKFHQDTHCPTCGDSACTG